MQKTAKCRIPGNNLVFEPAVRLRAATSLGDYGDLKAVPALQQAAKDPHKAVRIRAQVALKRLGR